ncbi:MAG TPA: hypothetical protein VMW38_20045, partial [Terriglobia bacterium]|nr:hypothetical protein [Terriglobia bacterium]
HPFPLPQHQKGAGGEGVNRRERPPRAAAAAPAADGALGYCLPPPAGLNKGEAASCRFTNVQSPDSGLSGQSVGTLPLYALSIAPTTIPLELDTSTGTV